MQGHFYPENFEAANRAFLFGDAVKAHFFVRKGRLVMHEECYFFLMASMRKMRMNIPLGFTLEFFENLFSEKIIAGGISDAVITFLAYRAEGEKLWKSDIHYWFRAEPGNIFDLRQPAELDILKEINVNAGLLSSLRVHCPENIYAEIYARENDLDDVILLNPHKRIARSIWGNLLFLEGNDVKIPKQAEGAYISPMMENFVTFLHKKSIALITEAEFNPFESQKADEIIIFSDERGITPVRKIRSKEFPMERFPEMIREWQSSFAVTD